MTQSNTPRTDGVFDESQGCSDFQQAIRFSRLASTLERELSAMTAERDELKRQLNAKEST